MFIHWDLTQLPGGRSNTNEARVSRSEYRRITERFKPFGCRPKLGEACGRRGCRIHLFYIETSRRVLYVEYRSDGFQYIWRSRKDIFIELADACLKHDIALSIYYSIPDWNHPNAYNEKSSHQCPPEAGDEPDDVKYREFVRAQAKELLTGYGDIYTWFWDIPPRVYDPSMNEYLRQLQPDLLINDRGWSKGIFQRRNAPFPKRRISRIYRSLSIGRREQLGIPAE